MDRNLPSPLMLLLTILESGVFVDIAANAMGILVGLVQTDAR